MAGRADPCAGCVYQVKVGDSLLCDYILMTGHRRPCPFGAGCTVKETEENMKQWNKARAYELYMAGARDKEIAAEVGVNPNTIYKWRVENGLAAHRGASHTPTADTGPGPEPKPPEPEAASVSEPSPESGTINPIFHPRRPDRSEPEGTGVDWPQGPVELHVELYGGWARIRAPGWEQAARLWRMLDVCISALRTEGGVDG